MKKLFLTAIFAAVVTATPAQLVQFGLKGGVNITDVSISDDMLDGTRRGGFFVGGSLKFNLPLTGFGFDISALYEERSAKLRTNGEWSHDFEHKIKQQSINVPINIRYDIELANLVGVFIFAGPQVGFNVGDDYEEFNDGHDSRWDLEDTNFSVNVGFGVLALNHLQLSANYNIACGKTGEASLYDDKWSGVRKKKGRDNTWQIALAYYF